MKRFLAFIPFIMTSCQSLPELYQSAEDVLDDNAIRVEVSREAMSKDKEINLNIQIHNVGK
jgi:hypothetical protein